MKIKKINLRFKRTLAVLLILVSAFFVFSRLTASPASADWYNDSWNYRIGLTFTNAGSADTNKYVTVTLTTNASPLNKLQANCNDARFTDSNGKQLQYYQTNTCQAASTIYHVLMPSIPVGGNLIYFYYGNPTVTAGKNSSDFTVTEFTTGTVTQGSESIGPGPVAYWKFDDGQGTAVSDATSGNNSATITNATWQTEDQCISGKCLYFNGTSAFVKKTVTNFRSSDTSGTFEAWIRSDFSNQQTIFASAKDGTPGYALAIGLSWNTGKPYIWQMENDTTTTTITGTQNLTANRWYHITVTSSGSLYKIFVNGIEQPTTTDAGTNNGNWFSDTTNRDNITIGKAQYSGSSNTYFKGFIDEVKVYPYARTATQIATDYNAGKSKSGAAKGVGVALSVGSQNSDALSQGLIGYWNMDDASATTTITDSSGMGNTGTLQQAQETNTTLTGSTISSISDTANAQLNSEPDDMFNGMNLILSGASCNINGQQRGISDYVSTTKTFSVSANFTAIPDTANCGYTIDHRSGGKFGKGILYDGVDDYAAVTSPTIIDNLDANSGSYTVSVWVNSSSPLIADTGARILDWGAGASHYPFMLILGASSLTANPYDGTNAPQVSYGNPWDGNWHHIVFVVNAADRKLYGYKDGQLSDSTQNTVTGATTASGADLRFANNNANRHFHGIIDEIRIYNRALSSSEVTQLYNWAPGPIGWWKLDEGTSNKAYDSSGYGATGTLSSTTGAWVTGKYGGGINAVNTNRIQLTSTFSAKGLAAITTEAWVYPTSNLTAGNWDYIFASRASDDIYARIGLVTQYNYVCTANNTFASYYRSAGQFSSTVCSTTQYQLNRWYHVASVYNTLTHIHKLYVDGVLVNTSTDSAPIMDSATDLENSTIGSWTAGGNKMNGFVDDVKVYSYERTPAQIVEDMQGGKQNQTLVKYDFNEASGTIINNTGFLGSTANATVSGTIWNMDGKTRAAQQFTGSASYVSTPKLALIAANAVTYNSLSWGGWFKPTNTAASKSLIIKPTEFRLTTDASSRPNCAIYSGSWQTAAVGITALPLNAWSHVLCTYDGANINVFVNGTKANGPVAQSGNITSSSSYALNLGWNYAGGEYFQGLMDDVKVNNFAMTADQIKTSINSGVTTVMGALSTNSQGIATNSASAQFCPPGDTSACSAPVAYWKFDENTGTSAKDSSGNGITLGTFGTNVSWKPGKTGSALSFSGTGTQTRISNTTTPNLAIPTQISFSAWIYPKSLGQGNNGCIFAQFNGLLGVSPFAVCLSNSPNVNSFELYSTWNPGTGMWVSPANSITLNAWNYITGTYNKSSTSNDPLLYVNGKSVTVTEDVSPSGSATNDDLNTYIGNDGDSSPTTAFDGLIDNIKIYNYIRTPAQIAWDMNRGAPVAQYKFEECQGNILHNYSGNSLHGTWSGTSGGTQTAVGNCTTAGTAWGNGAVGKYNSSLNYDGSDDIVSISSTDLLTLSAGGTISAWIKPNSIGEVTGRIIDKSTDTNLTNGYGMFMDNGGNNVQVKINNSSSLTTTGSPIPYGSWSMVTWTFDGSYWKIYVNGKLNIGDSIVTLPPNTAGGVSIGNRDGATDRTFDGQIDDVRIYNYALTGQQIKTLYNNGSAVSF